MKTSVRILYLLFAYSAPLGVLLIAGLLFLPMLTGPSSGVTEEDQRTIWGTYVALVAFLPILSVLLTHRYFKKKLGEE
ncbi:MAG: hypothetical protein AAFP70_19080 [Calditrichota bacterium]